MDLSVIIVNWNTRDLVLECLGSLYDGVGNPSMEVIVVDNGSSDRSVEAIRGAFPDVVLIENQKNLGFAKAVNVALGHTTGECIMLLNSDVILQENTVAALMGFMGETPEASVGGAQLLNPDGTKQNSIDNFPTLLSEGLNKSLLRILLPGRFPSKRLSLEVPLAVESVIGACAVVRRRAIDDIGSMDEDYFLFMEETDWCYRMREKGWKVYLVPQARAIHRQGATVGRVKSQAKVEYYRSRYLFFKKHRGCIQVGVLAGILVLKLCISLIASGLVCLFTLFHNQKARQKLVTAWTLFVWHARFCPEEGGLDK